MKTILMIGSLLLAAFAAWADLGVSGSGEWVIDGDTFVVSNGTVSVNATLSVTTVRINEGATLKLGTDTPFAAEPAVLLFGTLDLNGKSLSVASFSTRHPDGDDVAYAIPGNDTTRYIASSEAMITNSANTVATLTKTGDEAFDTGAAIATNVKVVLNGTKDLQAFGRFGGTGPGEVDVKAREFLAMSRPVSLLFVFKEVVGTGTNALLRLSELVPTCRGVPLTELGYTVTCRVKTPGVTETTVPRWVDGSLMTDAYASTKYLVSPGAPHVILVTFGGTRGYPLVDGYRFGTANEPAYTPKTWDVYAIRVDDMGATLVDSRENDKVNRPEFEPTTDRDVWSQHLSDNYTFKWPLGDPVCAGTDLVLDAGKARFTVGEPVSVGAVSGSGKITLDQDSVICPKSLADWTGIFSVNEAYGFLGEGPGVLLSSVRGAAE